MERSWVPATWPRRARQVFENLRIILEAEGATFADVVKMGTYVTSLDDLAAVREVRQEYLGTEPPASTLVQVRALVLPERHDRESTSSPSCTRVALAAGPPAPQALRCPPWPRRARSSARVRALRSPDFRRLFLVRVASQFADGLFQVSLIASVVFSPDEQSTTVGLFKATVIIAVPYSVIGPFTGVFIDRWPRRRILTIAPWIKTALVWLVLFDPVHAAVLFYAGALIVLSVNRFFLATAQAVVPRLVPAGGPADGELAGHGRRHGRVARRHLSGRQARRRVRLRRHGRRGAGALWLVGSWIASRIRSDLAPHTLPEDPTLLATRAASGRSVSSATGSRASGRSPRALGPITSIAVDQFGQGWCSRSPWSCSASASAKGVGSFSNLIGAGGIGVMLGILTVGASGGSVPEGADRGGRVPRRRARA